VASSGTMFIQIFMNVCTLVQTLLRGTRARTHTHKEIYDAQCPSWFIK